MAEYKVLLPLDGSRTAEQALAYLGALRSLGSLHPLLMGVVDETEEHHGLSKREAGDRETNMLTTYLNEVAQEVHDHLDIEAQVKVARGSPPLCILDEAQSFAPDLLVISTHGRSGITRWRLGSVADKVIRAANCNTLVVGPKAAEIGGWLDTGIVEPFESIMVPLDGSDLAEQALPIALRLRQAFNSEVHLVRAVGIPTAEVDGFAAESYIPDLLDTMMDAARTYIANVAQRLSGASVATDVLIGPAAFCLEDYIKEKGIDLVVMTTHGRGGFARTALGSVTDRLIGGSAPVLVVRAGATAKEWV